MCGFSRSWASRMSWMLGALRMVPDFKAAPLFDELEERSDLLVQGIPVDLRRRRVVLDGHAGGVEDRDLVVALAPGFPAKQDLADLGVDVLSRHDAFGDGVLRLALFDALRD